jgi:hypothetical protein
MRDNSPQAELDTTLTPSAATRMLTMYTQLWRRPLSPDELAHASKVFDDLESELRNLARR